MDEMAVYQPTEIEFLVRELSDPPFPRHLLYSSDGEGFFSVEDSENGLTYRLGPPSDEYITFLFCRLIDMHGSEVMFRHPLQSFNAQGIRTLQSEIQQNPIDVFDFFRRTNSRMLTLSVKSEQEIGFEELYSHATAMLFELGFNLDIALVPQRNPETVLRPNRIARMSRLEIGEIAAPRRRYDPELVYHYESAIGSNNLVLQYISYYHILEHFFEKVFWDDLLAHFRKSITRPGFSYEKDSDVMSLIKKLRKQVEMRDDSYTFSEEDALGLTLERFLDIDTLVEELVEYDEDLLEYYRNRAASFSSGPRIDLRGPDPSIIRKNLSGRIYKTRCALVHRKANKRSQYEPFKNERELAKEIPLLRFIAEQVMINSASVFAA